MDQAEKSRLYTDIRDIQRKQGVLVEHSAVQMEVHKRMEDKLSEHLKWHEALQDENKDLKAENKKMLLGVILAVISGIVSIAVAIIQA